MTSLLAFLGISILVIATPGPDTAVTIRSTMLGGRRAGTATALGVAGGQTIWALATSAGMVALLVASEPVFAAVRWAGAAYLVWLGVQALLAAWRGDNPTLPTAGQRPARLTAGAAFRQGMLSDLSNPKMAAFFTSLLPQFASSFEGLFLHGLAFAAMTCLWLAAYAAVLSRLGHLLQRTVVRRWVEAVTGAVLIALGLRVATER